MLRLAWHQLGSASSTRATSCRIIVPSLMLVSCYHSRYEILCDDMKSTCASEWQCTGMGCALSKHACVQGCTQRWWSTLWNAWSHVLMVCHCNTHSADLPFPVLSQSVLFTCSPAQVCCAPSAT